MEAVGALLTLPLILLNLLGGLIGGVGLLIQGEWKLVLGWLAYGIAGPFLLSIAMLPGMIFAPLSVWAAERGNLAAAVIAGLPSLLWTYVVLAVSCCVIFGAIVHDAQGGFFHLLWGYSISTAPWSYMARKEAQAGNETSATLVAFAQFGTISMMVAAYINPDDVSLSRLVSWFFPFLIFGLLVQLFTLFATLRAERRRASW